ncbi:MAG: hypothetical protein E6G85_23440 [Alphaproteobacteria bacterium]|nr:MAG: hypothetical protein E6G85_23440 [Alphaproteobacteria bacterium]
MASSAFGVSGLDDCGLGVSGFGASGLGASGLGASGLGASGLGASTLAEGIAFNGASDAVDGSEAAGLETGSAAGISGGAPCVLAAVSGLISILACCATLSDVGGTISAECGSAGASFASIPVAGIAGADGFAAREASAMGETGILLSGCRKATSMM